MLPPFQIRDTNWVYSWDDIRQVFHADKSLIDKSQSAWKNNIVYVSKREDKHSSVKWMLVDAVNDNADDEMNDESCNCCRFDDKLVNKANPNIADSFRSFESGFTAFKLGDENFSTEKKNFDLKEYRKLKYSRFELYQLAFITSIETILSDFYNSTW